MAGKFIYMFAYCRSDEEEVRRVGIMGNPFARYSFLGLL